MEDLSNYNKLRVDAQTYYNSVSRVFSPALNQDVVFGAEGFNHIVFTNPRSERERSSQILRFKLLHLAVKFIKVATVYQEFEESIKEFEVMSYKKKVKKIKPVKYWGIIGIIEGRKIKIIIRKIRDNGIPHFWSIVPAWVTNKYRDIKFYSTMKGNPEED